MSKLFAYVGLIVAFTLLLLTMPHLASMNADLGTNGPRSAQETQYIYLPYISRWCNCYYVDSVNGSDSNSGTSEDAAWRTLARVHATNFPPKSTIYFKRGSTWTGGLVIDDSGTENAPIVFTAYGTGDKPIFRNPGSPDNRTSAIKINADWVIVEGVLVRDAHEGGIYISHGSDHNVIRDVEATQVGTGIIIAGQYNLVTRNYVHALNMIRNTPGGDDDFGAVGVKLYNSYNEISHNRLENCIAPSYDYGMDGGAFEWWGNASGNHVHHNWATGNAGFLEVGGGVVKDTTVAYNVSVNNGRFSHIHLSGQFASTVTNFRLENNTLVEMASSSEPGWAVLAFGGDPTQDTFVARNNIFYIDEFKFVSNKAGFARGYNLYYLNNTDLGFALDSTEQIANPLFANLAKQDFHLLPESLAIDAGLDLGYTLDFDNQPVPYSTGVDQGAFEHRPTPIITPTPDPNEHIIDNEDPGFSTRFSQDAWQRYTKVGGQHYGATHYYNREISDGQDTATWAFTIPRPGRYQVYAWWWEGSWRPTDVPYTIHHLNGTTIVRVNQQTNGGQWNLLGLYAFQDRGSVVVSDDVSSGRDIVADAIRVVWVQDLP